MLNPDGTVADQIDGLWWFLLGLGGVVFAAFSILLALALFRRRADTAGDDDQTVQRRWIVGGGVAMPTVVIGIVIVATVLAIANPPLEQSAAEDRLVIEVVGHQWWWEIAYPDREVETANEIHIPVGEPVELELRSADVVHSFWVPALAGKLDLLPERTNTLVLDATSPGRYPARCAEFCGLQHARMELTVVAHEPASFERWVRAQSEPSVAASSADHDEARRLFSSAGCASCHTVAGTDASGESGPDLSHLASREAIGAGTLPIDTEALTRWVTDPHDVKTGVDMPAAEISDDDVATIVDYLEALE